MKLVDDFASECERFYRMSVAANKLPREIIDGLHSLLKEKQQNVSERGVGDYGSEIYLRLLAVASGYIETAITYQSPLSDDEEQVIEYFCEQNHFQETRCLSKKAIELQFAAQRREGLSEALRSLFLRGLVEDGEMGLSLCLTSTGRGYVHGRTQAQQPR